jgi:hypothetical protein
MANFIQLLGLPTVRRMESPELLAAVAQNTDGDPAPVAIAQAQNSALRLQTNLNVIDALGARIRLYPPLPAPQTLQDLVRSGRKRLLDERQTSDRSAIVSRQTAVSTVLTVLQS